MIKKIIVIVMSLLVLGVLGAWLTQGQWLPQWSQDMTQKTQESFTKGLAFGKTADQQTCFDKALAGFKQCSGYTCTVTQGKFLKACWQNAKPSVGFCDAVPAFNEEKTEDEKTWARHQCWERNIHADGCRLLMRQQQWLCADKQAN